MESEATDDCGGQTVQLEVACHIRNGPSAPDVTPDAAVIQSPLATDQAGAPPTHVQISTAHFRFMITLARSERTMSRRMLVSHGTTANCCCCMCSTCHTRKLSSMPARYMHESMHSNSSLAKVLQQHCCLHNRSINQRKPFQ